MRVAILTDNHFGKVTGVTTTLRAVLKHAAQDVEPHVYTLADAGLADPGYTAIEARGVPVPFSREMRMYAPRFAALKRRLLADHVCAIHMTTPGPMGLAARHLARTLNLPLIGSCHTELGAQAALLSGSPPLGRLMQSYIRWLYGGCHRVLVPSETARRHLASTGWRDERLTVWSRGVDSERFAPARRSTDLRVAWQVSENRPAILYAGRLSHEKGLDLLTGLRTLLDEHRMPHRFILAGPGPMRADLRAMLPDAVFAGVVAHELMGEVMASADIFIFPSGTDTAGDVVLEAQSAGLPVLVTDRGGLRENVLDRSTGYVCREGSERDFCLRVAELLTDPARRREMGAAARRYAAARGWAQAMQPLFACYRETLLAARVADGSHGVSPRAEAHV